MRACYYERGKKEVDRREGREEEGICRTNVKVLLYAPPIGGRRVVRDALSMSLRLISTYFHLLWI